MGFKVKHTNIFITILKNHVILGKRLTSLSYSFSTHTMGITTALPQRAVCCKDSVKKALKGLAVPSTTVRAHLVCINTSSNSTPQIYGRGLTSWSWDSPLGSSVMLVSMTWNLRHIWEHVRDMACLPLFFRSTGVTPHTQLWKSKQISKLLK